MMNLKPSQTIVGCCCLIGIVLCCLAPVSAQDIFHDPLDDSTGTNLTVLGTNLNNSTDIAGFNYATGLVGAGDAVSCPAGCPAGIPEAPHSNVAGGDAPRTGLLLAANVADGVANEVVAYIKDPETGMPFTVSGNYTAQVDVWMNYDVLGGGTTQNAGMFLGGDGTSVRPNGPGFTYTGDGGFAGDYMMFKGGHAATPGDAGNIYSGRILSNGPNPEEAMQYDQALFDGNPDPAARVNEHDNPVIANAFCSQDCSANLNGFMNYDIGFALDPDDAQGEGNVGTIQNGAGGFRWMTITIEVEPNTIGPAGVTNTPGLARVSITTNQQPDPANPGPLNPLTVPIGVIDNSTGGPVVDMTGSILLHYGDYFASLNTSGFQFGVFDNLIITQEETPGITGDFSGNGAVENADLTLLLDNWGATVPPIPAGWVGSQPTSPAIDNDELTALLDNWGAGGAGGAASSASGVPEPSTAVLLLSMMLAFRLKERRKGTV